MLLTLEETKAYLHVDSNDDNGYITELIQTAEDYIIDSIDNYNTKINNTRFKRKARICSLALIQECFDNRILCTKENEKLRYMISSILLQMQYGNFEVVI